LPRRPSSSPGRRRTRRNRPFRQLSAQGPGFLETDCYVAQDRRDPFHSARIVPEWQDRELDRDTLPASSQRRHRQNFAGAVTGAPALHRGRITGPMTRAQAFWDDDVEGLAQRFRFGKAEDSRGTEVPKSNDALGVGINDRVGASRRILCDKRPMSMATALSVMVDVASDIGFPRDLLAAI